MNTINFDLALRFRESPSARRVRVAILDTGCDHQSPFFRAVRQKRLVVLKDFTKDDGSSVDEDGHGTYVTSQVMKIAPAADICAARVAKNSEGLQMAANNIAKVR